MAASWSRVAGGGGWGLRLAIAGVLVVLGIAIGWGLYGNTPSPLNFTSDPGAKSDGITPVVLTPPRQLHSLGGLTGLMEQMKQRFRDTNGYRLVVYPDYASLTRPDPTEERRELNYTYRGGWDDPTSSASTPTGTRRHPARCRSTCMCPATTAAATSNWPATARSSRSTTPPEAV